MAGGDVTPLLVGSREGVRESWKPQSISVPTLCRQVCTLFMSRPLFNKPLAVRGPDQTTPCSHGEGRVDEHEVKSCKSSPATGMNKATEQLPGSVVFGDARRFYARAWRCDATKAPSSGEPCSIPHTVSNMYICIYIYICFYVCVYMCILSRVFALRRTGHTAHMYLPPSAHEAP